MERNRRSLEQASVEADQVLRVFSDIVARELDTETTLAVEVNGVPVGTIVCFDSALAELAAGWAFMHRFYEAATEFSRSHAEHDRASVMIHGGRDIEAHLAEHLGTRRGRLVVPEPWPRQVEWSIPDDMLLDIIREAWGVFRGDRLAEGSIHAALASGAGIEVVAFDLTAENAVAKVLGWALRSGEIPTHEILIVNGLVTRAMVDAAVRLGVLLIATPNVASNDAWRAAHLAGISIVGYMRHRTVGLFHDAGLVTLADPGDSDN